MSRIKLKTKEPPIKINWIRLIAVLIGLVIGFGFLYYYFWIVRGGFD